MNTFLTTSFEIVSAFLLLLILLVIVVTAFLYIADIRQTRHAIRRNYPVIGRFRYWFEYLGEFFRQYFFAMDREELPFNRAERSWVYRAAKGLDNTVAFGSTRDLRRPGTVIFANCAFPSLKDNESIQEVAVGSDCPQPYRTASLFNVSAMSYGSISKPAIQALSRGAYLAEAWLNTGEGGLSPYHLEGGCDLVFQIGTAKYGARDIQGNFSPEKFKQIAHQYQVKIIEVKLSQGAKPGKGGILPARKVTQEIATIRGIPAGKASISPNRYPEIANVSQLLDFLNKLKDLSGKPVGFKMVLGSSYWLDELAEQIIRRGVNSGPDFITLDSADGGTGAAPMPLIDDMGLPLRESLPFLVDKLNEYGLRESIKVIASGKLITPASVAWAYCVGADLVASARGNMFALGCIQALQCNKNTCPTGITTHDPDLQKGLVPEDKALRVAQYIKNISKEVTIIAHSCGVSDPRQLRRHHARIVSSNGMSIPLDKLYPEAQANSQH